MNKTNGLIVTAATLYLGYKALRGHIVEYKLRTELRNVVTQKDIAEATVVLSNRLINIQKAEIEKLKGNSKEDQGE